MTYGSEIWLLNEVTCKILNTYMLEYITDNNRYMTKVGTFHGKMDKLGTFRLLKAWYLYDWSLYITRFKIEIDPIG